MWEKLYAAESGALSVGLAYVDFIRFVVESRMIELLR